MGFDILRAINKRDLFDREHEETFTGTRTERNGTERKLSFKSILLFNYTSFLKEEFIASLFVDHVYTLWSLGVILWPF